MHRYSLRFAAGVEDERIVEFDAISLDAALSVAKRTARGDWAELYENDMPLCRLQLTDSTGVWRIASLRGAA